MKKETWSIYNVVWLAFAVAVTITSSFLQEGFNKISTISAVLGVLYTIFVAKNNRISFLFGLGNVSLLGIMLFKSGVYAGAFYNILYSVPMLIWGFINWSKKQNDKNSGIKKIQDDKKGNLVVLIFVAITIYALILKLMNSNEYLLDAATAVLGFVGTYLMTNKYMEQWGVWVISNFLNVALWTSLTLTSINNLPVLVMWIIYLINSIYGYIVWHKKYKKI